MIRAPRRRRRLCPAWAYAGFALLGAALVGATACGNDDAAPAGLLGCLTTDGCEYTISGLNEGTFKTIHIRIDHSGAASLNGFGGPIVAAQVEKHEWAASVSRSEAGGTDGPTHEIDGPIVLTGKAGEDLSVFSVAASSDATGALAGEAAALFTRWPGPYCEHGSQDFDRSVVGTVSPDVVGPLVELTVDDLDTVDGQIFPWASLSLALSKPVASEQITALTATKHDGAAISLSYAPLSGDVTSAQAVPTNPFDLVGQVLLFSASFTGTNGVTTMFSKETKVVDFGPARAGALTFASLDGLNSWGAPKPAAKGAVCPADQGCSLFPQNSGLLARFAVPGMNALRITYALTADVYVRTSASMTLLAKGGTPLRVDLAQSDTPTTRWVGLGDKTDEVIIAIAVAEGIFSPDGESCGSAPQSMYIASIEPVTQ